MLGCDPDEVHAFLKAVADEMENLYKEKSLLKEEIREKETQVIEYRERDKALRETISTAHKMSQKVKDESEREAKLIIANAEQQGEMIVKDARDSLRAIYKEICDLKKIQAQYETNMKALLQAHMSLLDQKDDFLPRFVVQEPENLKRSMGHKREENPSEVKEVDQKSEHVSPLSL